MCLFCSTLRVHSFLFIVLIICFLPGNYNWTSIYTLVGKKLYILLNYAEILLKAFFWSLLEMWCNTFSSLQRWGHSDSYAKNQLFTARWSPNRFTPAGRIPENFHWLFYCEKERKRKSFFLFWRWTTQTGSSEDVLPFVSQQLVRHL